MNENEKCEATNQVPATDTASAEEASAKITAESSAQAAAETAVSEKQSVCYCEKCARRRAKAEQAALYQQRVSEVRSQNADYLNALAGYATEKVPSAAGAISLILKACSTPSAPRPLKF